MPSTQLLWLLILLVGVAGCRRSVTDDERARNAPPPAAVVASPSSARLIEQLAELEAALDSALADGLEERGLDDLLRAEAITDRILEADRRVDWLPGDYDVEARVRQLQALADRLIALLRRGAPVERVLEDTETLRRAAADLRSALEREGGGERPPSLDSLLAPYRTGDRSAAAAAARAQQQQQQQTGPQPLGRPVQDDTTGI